MQKLKKIRTGPVQKKLFRPAGKESSTGPDRTGPDRPVTGTGYSSGVPVRELYNAQFSKCLSTK
jgi:hypothetical protein